MNVTVVGATGRIGKRVARMLVEQGHDVLGVNRRPERATIVLASSGVWTDVADAGDLTAVTRCVSGADVVVLATAPTREDPRSYLGQTATVIRAVKHAGARLVAIGNHMALRAPDGRTMLEAAPPHPYFRPIEEVFAEQADLLRVETELEWLLVCPPAELFPYGEVTRRYRVGEDVLLVTAQESHSYSEVSCLSMEDLAAFVVDEIEQPRYRRRLVTLAY